MINLFCIRPKGFNVGNDVIFLGTQHFLYRAFGEVVNLISLPATSRYESHAKAGLTAKTIYEINQYGHGVIVGGGNLYENGELDVDLDSLDSLEPPMMLFSLSRGRVYNRRHQLVRRTDTMPDRVMRALDSKAEYALFRDHATGSHLESIGCTHCEVGGCPTIFLDQITGRLPSIPADNRSTVLISIRQPSLMSIPLTKQSQVYQDVLGIIDLLQRRGYKDVRLLCHDHRDISFAASFPNIEYVYTGDVYTYLAMLKECVLNITYRLHSFLPCLSFGVPSINISYDERAESLVKTIGMGNWNINMIEEEDVVSQVADRFRRLDDLSTLRQTTQDCWNKLHTAMSHTFTRFSEVVRSYHDSNWISTSVTPGRPRIAA